MDFYVPVNEYIVCDCGTRIAKRTGWFQFEISTFRKGEQIKIKSEYDGTYKVGCKKCGFATMFVSVKESIGIGEQIQSSVA